MNEYMVNKYGEYAGGMAYMYVYIYIYINLKIWNRAHEFGIGMFENLNTDNVCFILWGLPHPKAVHL